MPVLLVDRRIRSFARDAAAGAAVLAACWLGARGYLHVYALANPDTPRPITHSVFAAIVAAVASLGTFLAITAHELAHALAAKRCRATVSHVRVGAGPSWAAVRVADIPIQFRCVPISGETGYSAVTNLSFRQKKQILLAGVRVHALLVLLMIPALAATPVVATAGAAFAAVNAMLYAINACALKPVPGRLPTDGWQLQELRRAARKGGR